MDGDTLLKQEVAALTDVGCQRANNEDSFGYDADAGIFVVCDGMGGMAAGELASDAAVKALLEHFCQAAREQPAHKRLHDAIVHANQEVFQISQSKPELRGMGTTMVAAYVEGKRLLVGNVGDSRAYLLRGDGCAQITQDHSFVAEQVRLGSMNPEEADSSPYQSLITRAVGSAAEVEPDIFTGMLEPGDILLLTTDGLTRYLDADTIAGIIKAGANLTEACHRLIDTAKNRGGADNVTCLLIRFEMLGEGKGNQPTEPAA
ncbi:MAG TPA: Stp1/IreP family PP2C-type Ser/Thr phosphatase [Terracidiphilus sp.]|nr:Stp1/IreP family PP2C-type Ser/Thr phosphatase [Terracidiphilus sp.]